MKSSLVRPGSVSAICIGSALCVVGIALSIAGCTPKQKPAEGTEPSGAASVAPSGVTSPAPSEVSLATWSNYVAPGILEKFEKDSGIKVRTTFFSSNEELLAKVQTGGADFDVVVPSDYMVEVLKGLGLLKELDRTELGFMNQGDQMDPRFMKRAFDPENKYSVPFAWGTTGLIINHTQIKGKIEGWKDLIASKEAKGKIALLDDAREVLGAFMRIEGSSANVTDGTILDRAKKALIGAKSRIKAFTSEPLSLIVNRDLLAAQIYQSDALIAKQRSQDQLEYLLPKEGCTLYIDNLVILKSSARFKEAHALVRYLMSPEVLAETVKSGWIGPTRTTVRDLLPEKLKQDSVLFPPAGAIERCEMLKDLGTELAQFDQRWTEIKAE